MAAIVCQELVESRIHRLRLPSPKPKPLTSHPIDLAFKSCLWESNSKPHYEENTCKTHSFSNNLISSNPNQGGWSFIQGLSNISKETLHKETTYVHPQEKHSSVKLSLKSLELCTEDLGNETGTDIIESDIEFLSSWGYAKENLRTREESKSRQVLRAKKSKPHDFPPPLTTIRGSESLQVRPHREGGRLVIEVTKVPSSTSCFHAERSHGRLRLCLVKYHTPYFDPEEGFEEELEEVEEEKEIDDNEKETEEEAQGIENKDIYGKCGSGYKETNRDIWTNECAMRMRKYERTCRRNRCKEGDHENKELLINWVATS